MKDREYMLKVIWRSIPEHHTKYKWMDGSSNYYLTAIKMEDLGGKLELYITVSSLYTIVPIHGVWHAYNNGIQALSDSVALSVFTEKANSKAAVQTPQTVDSYNKKIKKLLGKGTINLNQIKENYERQRTTD